MHPTISCQLTSTISTSSGRKQCIYLNATHGQSSNNHRTKRISISIPFLEYLVLRIFHRWSVIHFPTFLRCWQSLCGPHYQQGIFWNEITNSIKSMDRHLSSVKVVVKTQPTELFLYLIHDDIRLASVPVVYLYDFLT